MSRAPILFAAAPATGRAFVEHWRAATEPVAFCCVLAHTDTCLVPGLSAAGVSDAARPLTPAADAEVVLLGEPLCLPGLPSHPSGAAGPSGITRAALRLSGVPPQFVGAGLRVWPGVECARLSAIAGADITSGAAVPEAAALFDIGAAVGRDLAARSGRVIIGESVPGGTTTALALLVALGFAAEGRVSGSQPGNAHALKTRVVRQALRAARLCPGDGRADPLAAVAAVGDPMQPIVAGMAIAAARAGATVLLAGGSQMVAVAALIAALDSPRGLRHMAVGTTRWVVCDPAADVPRLAQDVCASLPVLAANLDFSHSPHAALRAYEGWLVKEGVGAGGACVALLASGCPIERLEAEIDATYASLVGRLQADPA